MIAPISSPARLLRGRLGVVLLSMGGPVSEAGVAPYLERRWCEERRFAWLPSGLCRRVVRLLARRRASALRQSLTHVGGSVPEARLVRSLARLVEETLSEHRPNASWTVVAATAYGEPSMTAAAEQLRAAEVERIVVVPLLPVWMEGTSDALVRAWRVAQAAAGLDAVPADLVRDVSTVPGYTEALGERLAEALQRFPRTSRDGVQVVFALRPSEDAHSPLAAVADRVAAQGRLPHRTATAPVWGGLHAATSDLDEVLTDLVRAGERRLLVVPVGFVHETMDTAYELDVVQRAAAERLGVVQYEVAACLNLHETCVGVLATAVCDALGVPDAVPVAAMAA